MFKQRGHGSTKKPYIKCIYHLLSGYQVVNTQEPSEIRIIFSLQIRGSDMSDLLSKDTLLIGGSQGLTHVNLISKPLDCFPCCIACYQH